MTENVLRCVDTWNGSEFSAPEFVEANGRRALLQPGTVFRLGRSRRKAFWVPVWDGFDIIFLAQNSAVSAAVQGALAFPICGEMR